jgi:hypothetical protein
MLRTVLVILVGAMLLPGCAVHEVHKDHDLIRTTLLDLYTNQIIDNIIRTANDMPIIQVDYSQATAMVTITNSIGGSDSQVTTASNLLTLPAATLQATRTIMTTLTGNLGNMNANQVTIQASPLITNDDVYNAYLQFLAHPGNLMITDCPPPPGAAHICKKQDKNYYWVPREARGMFMNLALQTTAQRGKPVVLPDKFFAIKLTRVLQDDSSAVGKGAHVLTVEIEKTLPLGTGHLTLDDDKSGEQLLLQEPDITNNTIRFSVKEDTYNKIFMSPVFPLGAKVYLLNQRPAPPSTEELINRVNYNLQQIQFNQLRQPAG